MRDAPEASVRPSSCADGTPASASRGAACAVQKASFISGSVFLPDACGTDATLSPSPQPGPGARRLPVFPLPAPYPAARRAAPAAAAEARAQAAAPQTEPAGVQPAPAIQCTETARHTAFPKKEPEPEVPAPLRRGKPHARVCEQKPFHHTSPRFAFSR